MSIFLRPNQHQILDYSGGKMAISAVPGSGKTFTLALLAAEIISKNLLADDQEVLIVTLVNSAVDNFAQRISLILQEKNLIPYTGFRVRTLHGLAHDIVRQRPDLVGLDANFQILDENDAAAIIHDISRIWLHQHPGFLEAYFNPDLDDSKLDWVVKEWLPDLVQEIALVIIRYAKDQRLSPDRLLALSEQLEVPLPLARLGIELYQEYQAALAYRGAVDFDDLVRFALTILETDQNLLERLSYQWHFILEDEAQDSSRLQEEILELLTRQHGNWVRVGDPNQAIYETFTTASPKHLLSFLDRPDVRAETLPHSGRSTQSIIDLANYLVRWTVTEHPTSAVRDALSARPMILPTPPDDPHKNPEDEPQSVHIYTKKLTPKEEIKLVVSSLERWLPEHPNETVAVLTALNTHAKAVVDALQERNIPFNDSLLKSSNATRKSASLMGNILKYLADPQSPSKLAAVFEDWAQSLELVPPEGAEDISTASAIIRRCEYIEDFISPGPKRDLLQELNLESESPALHQLLSAFRSLTQKWLESVLLPIDQLILTLAQDLFKRPHELALAHKISNVLKLTSRYHPDWRLAEWARELTLIANNERRFIGFSEDDLGFDPSKYAGIVTVSTLHKAKGLEWDRVYILSVNNYDFPSGQSHDTYISEKWFVRDSLNLASECLAQLQFLTTSNGEAWYEEGSASQAARLDYVRERLRLLYVGITRAKKSLIMVWNNGRKGDLQAATPLIALSHYWNNRQISA